MITFCIPTKNNLRYLKNSIRSIKQNQFYDNEIVVFVDSDNDGTVEWLVKNNIRFIKNLDSKPTGIAYGYNRCIELATNEIVMMFHADMFMGKHMDRYLLEIFSPNKVISATRIEPPLHPNGKEKIIKDFGMYPEDFKEEEFNKFVEEYKDSTKVTNGIFAPWLCSKKKLLEIGMHDESLHSYYEDSDIFNRMLLSGLKLEQSWRGLVYHLTCRGGVFQDGVEKKTSDSKFYSMQNRSHKTYLRKWGTWISNDEYQHPILYPRYQKRFHIKGKNVPIRLISLLEPWCDSMSFDYAPPKELKDYIENEDTEFNLEEKFKGNPCDITVEFDWRGLTDKNFEIIKNLPLMISEAKETGVYEIDIFKITVNRIEDLSSHLIKNENFYNWAGLIRDS